MASHNQTEHPAALPGDIVQVTDQRDPWYLALLVVEENRHWGLKAHANVPSSDGVSEAYYRIAHGKYVVVGAAALVTADVATARKQAVETAKLLARESQQGKNDESASAA